MSRTRSRTESSRSSRSTRPRSPCSRRRSRRECSRIARRLHRQRGRYNRRRTARCQGSGRRVRDGGKRIALRRCDDGRRGKHRRVSLRQIEVNPRREALRHDPGRELRPQQGVDRATHGRHRQEARKRVDRRRRAAAEQVHIDHRVIPRCWRCQLASEGRCLPRGATARSVSSKRRLRTA